MQDLKFGASWRQYGGVADMMSLATLAYLLYGEVKVTTYAFEAFNSLPRLFSK
jgi:hypothetical protein